VKLTPAIDQCKQVLAIDGPGIGDAERHQYGIGFRIICADHEPSVPVCLLQIGYHGPFPSAALEELQMRGAPLRGRPPALALRRACPDRVTILRAGSKRVIAASAA
jgi:hypothetical protein